MNSVDPDVSTTAIEKSCHPPPADVLFFYFQKTLKVNFRVNCVDPDLSATAIEKSYHPPVANVLFFYFQKNLESELSRFFVNKKIRTTVRIFRVMWVILDSNR